MSRTHCERCRQAPRGSASLPPIARFTLKAVAWSLITALIGGIL